MDDDKCIYRKIFDLADNNLKRQGAAFCYSYEAFSTLIGKAPHIVHTDEFAGLNMEDYLTVVYLRCLNRLPDQNSYKMYDISGMETEAAKKYMMLFSIVHSAEFAAIHKKVIGMEVQKREWKKDGHYRMTHLLRLTMRTVKAKCIGSLLMPIWIRLPNKVRKTVHKITGRRSRQQ